ncbi:mCG117709, isoform CRA_a [Mus musculus]|nr:mCG117709, isoform CRA_a [Mus musculus]EDL00730.1 mCG117709, isoform CRA_a [Mus musculus]
MSHFCIPPSLLLHLFSYFMCFVCMFMDYMRALPTKARRSCGIPWNWSNQQFVCTMWVMGIEPGSSIRLASALNY